MFGAAFGWRCAGSSGAVDVIIGSFGCSWCCLSDVIGAACGWRRAGSSGVHSRCDCIGSFDSVGIGCHMCLVQLLGGAELVHQV